MEGKSILIVDDEKNIRLTMRQSLELLGTPVETAINGEEALDILKQDRFGIVFLDLKMPGIDGMEVLRWIKDNRPKTRVIIITAHGTIDTAVEAMKLGAVDFIQKPFTPDEIRELVALIQKRENIDDDTARGYLTLLELTKRYITDRDFETARAIAAKTIAAGPNKPEAYNLLGGLFEITGDWLEAQKFYRAALVMDATYKPAQANLERTVSLRKMGKVDFDLTKDGTFEGPSDQKGDKDER
jgi:two-component system, OmpR family, alkaline phosphatase synthesis response regulator PhoP